MSLFEENNPFFQVVELPGDIDAIATEFTNALTIEARQQESIQNKLHHKYLMSYLFTDLDGLKIKTLVIEKYYTSASYLDDYFNYYSKCYYPYQKQCRRVHFFEEKFNREVFIEMLAFNKFEENWKSYKGHIVVKPLPKGIIGASLIAPYENKKERYYTAIRPYKVNLFGKELQVNTMSYQEQDSIVGSCASASIWFAFQKTAQLFGTKTPSPSIITLSAGHDSYSTGKTFPSDELERSQICKAISANGLISEVIENEEFLSDSMWLRSFLYSYSKMGIPILLGIDLENDGAHLITLNGYRFGDKTSENSKNRSKLKLNMVSDNISKFYVHDDQSGPFARLTFLDKDNETTELYQFRTSLWQTVESDIALCANASLVIVPLVESIKVKFENILEQATLLNFDIRSRMGLDLIWDIFIIESNIYKSDLREEMKNNFEEYDKKAFGLFLKSLPKYIWVVQGKIWDGQENILLFDFIYDAIDVNYKNSPYCINVYNEDFGTKAKEYNLFSISSSKPGIQEAKDSFSPLVNALNDDTKFIAIIDEVKKTISPENDSVFDIIEILQDTKIEDLRDSTNSYLEILSKTLKNK